MEAELEAVISRLGGVGINIFVEDPEYALESARSVKPFLPLLHAGGDVG